MIDIERTTTSFGFFGGIRRLGANAMAILHNRLELMAIEFKEEKSRVIALGIWAAAAIFLGFMTVVALMFTLVFVFWDQRIAVMGGFLGLFLIGAVVSAVMIKRKLKTPPFAETISQFKKDREWLKGR